MNKTDSVAMLRELLDEYPAPNFTAERAALTAAIAALEAQASAPGGEVTDAAYRWWLSRRPLAFNEAEHLANPGINTCSDAEKALAKAVAAALAARLAGEVTQFIQDCADGLPEWQPGECRRRAIALAARHKEPARGI